MAGVWILRKLSPRIRVTTRRVVVAAAAKEAAVAGLVADLPFHPVEAVVVAVETSTVEITTEEPWVTTRCKY